MEHTGIIVNVRPGQWKLYIPFVCPQILTEILAKCETPEEGDGVGGRSGIIEKIMTFSLRFGILSPILPYDSLLHESWGQNTELLWGRKQTYYNKTILIGKWIYGKHILNCHKVKLLTNYRCWKTEWASLWWWMNSFIHF